MPVLGEYKALIPAACGSISLILSGPINSNPFTLFAIPRSYKLFNLGNSSSSYATIIFPHLSYLRSFSMQKSAILCLPSTQKSALSDPGL